ncbi:MAG: DUF2318 domain-containing protein [Eubacterium sp.]|nr:DUF2318 domain-containing protein [Eubacterium sp.]
MKKLILPILAGVLLIAAAAVFLFTPASVKKDASSTEEPSVEGRILIKTADLKEDEVTFIRAGGDSRIELIARLGADGKPKVALGTCQSCNGAPGAYYSQDGDVLQCNNCGLTFPLEVIDQPGGGCHPITIDETIIESEKDGISIDMDKLSQYEDLFTSVKEH